LWVDEDDAMTTITAEKKIGDRFVDLAVTPEQAEELRLVMESSLADLHLEIAHTDRYELHEILKARWAVLQGVLRRLSAIPVRATTLGRHTEA
jgi:hypothetical protein